MGGLLSPLLANIALSVLDDAFAETWQQEMSPKWRRQYRRTRGKANWRLVRYADDFVVMVAGTREQTEALRDRVADVLAPMGLNLSDEKTSVTHIDEGFDFLGCRIQRKRKQGSHKRHVYTYPSKRAVKAVTGKVRALTHRSSTVPPRAVLLRINAVLRGWANYFRHGVSKRIFGHIDSYTWWRVATWLRKRHDGLSWKALRRRFMQGWDITIDGVTLIRAEATPVTRYRYRASIPSPWTALLPET